MGYYDAFNHEDEEYESNEYDNIFETFKQYYQFFDFSIETIELLEELTPDQLTDKNFIYEITPLLNEIANYGLINSVELEQLFGNQCEIEKDDIGESIFYLSIAAQMYMDKLDEDGCIHPTVLKYFALRDTVSSYEQIVDNMHKIKNYNDPVVNVNLTDFFNTVYANNLINEDVEFHNLMDLVDRYDHYKQLIRLITASSVVRFQRKALLLFPNDQNVIYYDTDSKLGNFSFKVNLNPMELVLSDTISFLDKLGSTDLLEKDMRKDVCDTVLEYNAYKSRQFNYIYESNEEAKVLSLCK